MVLTSKRATLWFRRSCGNTERIKCFAHTSPLMHGIDWLDHASTSGSWWWWSCEGRHWDGQSYIFEGLVDLLLAKMLPHSDRSGQFQMNSMWRHLMKCGVVRIMCCGCRLWTAMTINFPASPTFGRTSYQIFPGRGNYFRGNSSFRFSLPWGGATLFLLWCSFCVYIAVFFPTHFKITSSYSSLAKRE